MDKHANYVWLTAQGGQRAHAVINPRSLGVRALCGYRPAASWYILGGRTLPKCVKCRAIIAGAKNWAAYVREVGTAHHIATAADGPVDGSK